MNRFLKHTIVNGETLQSIATKYLGTADKALEIAVLNDLDYPFIVNIGQTASSGLNVKTAGDVILVPLMADSVSDLNDVYSDLDSINMGTDLQLVENTTNLSSYSGGEFATSLYHDLQTVSGIDTLSQDLLHRLLTPYGSLPHHPTYGSTFLTIVGKKNDTDWRQKASIELSRTFRSDPRVSDVKNVVVNSNSTEMYIECTIVVGTSQFTLKKVLKEA
jgi:phage baseplate assembly protein W